MQGKEAGVGELQATRMLNEIRGERKIEPGLKGQSWDGRGYSMLMEKG